jgi:hypothetical protein
MESSNIKNDKRCGSTFGYKKNVTRENTNLHKRTYSPGKNNYMSKYAIS